MWKYKTIHKNHVKSMKESLFKKYIKIIQVYQYQTYELLPGRTAQLVK